MFIKRITPLPLPPAHLEEPSAVELEKLAARLSELLEPKIADIVKKALEPVLAPSDGGEAPSVATSRTSRRSANARTWKDWTTRHWRTFNVAKLAEKESELIEEENHILAFLESAEAAAPSRNEDTSFSSLLTAQGGEEVYQRDTEMGDNELEQMPLDRDRIRRTMPRAATRRLTLNLAASYQRGAHSTCQSLWQSVEWLLTNAWFEHLMGLLVLCNALAIGIETDFRVRTGAAPREFGLVAIIFSLLFTTELVLRFLVNPFRFLDYHHRENFLWNIFDILVVGVQLADCFDKDEKQLSSFGLLRICRIFRILRLLRVVRFFSELRVLLSSMIASIESLIWALLLLICMVLTFATAFCQLVSETGFQTEHSKELREWFGSMGWSFLTLLQCITGGISWSEISKALIADVGIFAGVLLVFYIGLCLFALTNAVTGVFVSKITTAAVQDKSTYLAQQLREIFFTKETEQKDFITKELFKEKLNEKAMQDFFQSIDVDQEEHAAFFSLLDIDGNGQLTVGELVNGCLRLTGPAQALDAAVLMRQNTELMELLKS